MYFQTFILAGIFVLTILFTLNSFSFKSYIQKGKVPIKTLTLEKADVDGDGDMDIITGNFAQSPGPAPKALDGTWKTTKYGLSIFINQLHQPKK